MLRVIDHGDVTELEMSSAVSRMVGYKVSAYLIGGSLIDTGFPRARRDLARYLARGTVARAVLTHWHEDHSGNLDLIVGRGLAVTIAEDTRSLLRGAGSLPLYRHLVWGPARPAAVESAPLPEPLELIPTPGHTADHRAVWDPTTGTAFSGDLFLGVKACTVHPNEDPYQTLASVRTLRALGPERVFDAHRGRLPNPISDLDAKANWLAETIGRIELAMRRGNPDARIRDQVLGREEVIAVASRGEMSKLNFVRAIRARLATALS